MAQSETTLEELLQKADRLIRDARNKRKEADALNRRAEEAKQGADPGQASGVRSDREKALAEAGADYAAAVRLLEPELQRRESLLATASSSMVASDDRKELAVRLADCYGSLGGIARRADDRPGALEFYRKGRDLEANAAYEIKSTYNRVQWIVLQILVGASSDSRPGTQVIERARGMLDLLSKSIVQDVWTSADVVLLSAILEDRRRLRRAWDSLVGNEPAEDVYKSGLLVLNDLAEAWSSNEVLASAVDLYRSKLPDGSRT